MAELADMNDAGHLYERGFLLSLSKSSGLGMNCIGASKPLTVIVKHSNLPVLVLPPTIFPKLSAFSNFHLEKYITLIRLSTNEALEAHFTLSLEVQRRNN